MAWTWYHWIPNWASTEHAQTTCALTTGTEKEFYGAQRLVDDNPHSYCIFTPGSGTSATFALSGVGLGGTILTNLALINDDLPSDSLIGIQGWGGGILQSWGGVARGADEFFVKSFGGNKYFSNWRVLITNLTAYTWYRIGLIIIAREEEFSDQPTMPYSRTPVLEGTRHDNPAGRSFQYLKRHYWSWDLTWKNARNLAAITRLTNYQRVRTDMPFLIWEPVSQDYQFVRIVEPLEASLSKASGDAQKYLYSRTLQIKEAL